MPFAARDEKECSLSQLNSLSVHNCNACAVYHLEPLFGALVSVARPAFGLSRRERHLRRLTVLVAEHDPKAVTEL